jgi:hypothetical protein
MCGPFASTILETMNRQVPELESTAIRAVVEFARWRFRRIGGME